MRQSKEEKKQALISGMREVRQRILADARLLSPAEQDSLFLGKWNVKHLLAHLIGWDYANLQAIEAVQAGKVPEFYAHHSPDWRVYNDELVRVHYVPEMTGLMQEIQRSHSALLERAVGTPAETLFQDFGVRVRGYRVTIARLLEAEMKDEAIHLQQIQNFAKAG